MDPSSVLESTAAFVDAGQVAEEVAGIAAAAGYFASSRGELSDGVAVTGHIGQDDEHMVAELEGEVLSDSQRQPWGEDPFDDGVVGGVQEQGRLSGADSCFEPLSDEVGVGVGHSHASEHDTESCPFDAGLGGDLDRQLEVGKPADREDGELLTADEGREAVDGGDAGDHRVSRDVASCRVDGAAGDRTARSDGDDGWAAVDGGASTVVDPAEPCFGHRDLQRGAGERDDGCRGCRSRRFLRRPR